MQKLLNGAILIQARTTPRIRQIAELPFMSSPRLPTRAEVEEFLSFLSLIAMGNGFRYDPTVPDAYLAPFLESAEQLGLPGLAPIRRSTEHRFVEDMKTAFAMATEWVEDLVAGDLQPGHRKIPDASVEGFFACLSEMSQMNDPRERVARALESFNRDQQGAKLLVGLGAQENPRWLRSIATAAKYQNRDHLMSALINLFRPFLLSSWAGRHDAVFAGSDEALQRIKSHQLAFWKRLESELVERGRLELPTYDQQELGVPMLGPILLLAAPRGARPRDLVQIAVDARRELALAEFAETFWQIHVDASRGTPAELRGAIDDLWDRMARRGGPKKEALTSLAVEVAAAVTPALATGAAASAATVACGGDAAQSVASLAAGTLSALIFEVLRVARQRDTPAAVMSNLIAIHQDGYHLVDERVRQIWAPKAGTGVL